MVKTCKKGGEGSSRRRQLAAMKTKREAKKLSEQKKISALINDAFQPINNYSANERRMELEKAELNERMKPVVRQLVSDLKRFKPASGKSKSASGSYGFKSSSVKSKPKTKKKSRFWKRNNKSKRLSKTRSYNLLHGTNKYASASKPNPLFKNSNDKDE